MKGIGAQILAKLRSRFAGCIFSIIFEEVGKKVKNIIWAVVLVFLCGGVYSQITQGPPQPKTSAQQTDPRKGPCGQLPDVTGSPGRGNPPPPPPGLCLPINDYLVPLLVVGIVFGTYKVWRIEEAK